MRGILCFIILILALCFSYWGIGGKTIMNIIDVSSIFMIFIFPFIISSVTNNFHDFITALMLSRKKNYSKEILEKYKIILEMYSRNIILSNIMLILLCGISVLVSIGEKNIISSLVVNSSVIISSILYSVIIHLLLSGKLVYIKTKLIENE